MEQMGKSGIIGKSGKWYPHRTGRHADIAAANIHDVPFVYIRKSLYPLAGTEVVPTRAQFDTVVEWCAQHGKQFEAVAIAPEWGRWLTDEQKCYVSVV